MIIGTVLQKLGMGNINSEKILLSTWPYFTLLRPSFHGLENRLLESIFQPEI